MNELLQRPARLGRLALLPTALLFLLVFFMGSGLFGLVGLHSRTLILTLYPLGLAFLYALLCWWQSRLRRLEAEEAEEDQRVRKEYDREDLFQDRAEALRLAASARQAFERYFIPGFTLVFGLLLLGLALINWRHWVTRTVPSAPADDLRAAGLAAFLAVLALLAGSFFNGVSRERGCRRVRPLAQWLLLSFASFGLATLVRLLQHYRHEPRYDLWGANLLLLVLGVLGFELIVNFIIEFYRPRVAGEEPRPLHESRLLALVTDPGGIAHNVAHALDYQFGFKVSETWFYRFLERAVLPCVLVLLLALYLLDCVVLVESNELALKERFGQCVAGQTYGPGLYFKLPWPIERFRRFPVEQVERLNIGYTEQDEHSQQPGAEPPADPMMGDPTGKILVWGKSHYKKEERFVVGAAEPKREPAAPAAAPAPAGKPAPPAPADTPVNFLSVNIPVHYRIDRAHLADYAYNYQDPAKAFESLVTREVTRYLASTELLQLLGAQRVVAGAELKQRVEAALAELQPPLGITVEFVGLSGAHPPADVAESFQRVITADEEAKTKLLEAQRQQIELASQTAGECSRLREGAAAYRYERSVVPASEAARFREQLAGYRIAPKVFLMRQYLDTIEDVAAGARKYIVAAGSAREVYIIDLKEKLRPDLLDADLNVPKTK